MNNSSESKYEGLTSGRLLARNTIITVATKILPIIIGVVSVPYLIRELGTDNFGFLATIWLVIGYFSMLDIGVGQALIRLVSQKIGEKKYEEISGVAWTGIWFLSGMGLVAAVFLYFLGEFFLISYYDTSNDGVSREVISTSFLYTSIAVPFIVATTGFRAVLMAQQKMLTISIIQGLNSLFNYALPLLLIYFLASDFEEIVMALLILKMVAFLCFAVSTIYLEPLLREKWSFHKTYLLEMVNFGKWVMVSNIIGPLMGHLDRYIIGAFISLSLVTFYTTPLEVLTKVMILPIAFITVLFPAFSSLSVQSSEKREKLLLDGMASVVILLFPILLVLSTIADIGLNFWVGPEFVQKSTFIAQIFALVYFLRGVSYISSGFLHGLNRPDLTAKFHVVEIILFGSALYFVAPAGNINHIAFVSLGISILDTVLLFMASYRLLENKRGFTRSILMPFTLCALVLSVQLLSERTAPLVIFNTTAFVVFLLYYRAFIKTMIDRFLARRKPSSI